MERKDIKLDQLLKKTESVNVYFTARFEENKILRDFNEMQKQMENGWDLITNENKLGENKEKYIEIFQFGECKLMSKSLNEIRSLMKSQNEFYKP